MKVRYLSVCIALALLAGLAQARADSAHNTAQGYGVGGQNQAFLAGQLQADPTTKPTGDGVWTPLGGPTISGGTVRALAVHPAIAGTLYAAAQSPNAPWGLSSFLYKSSDGAAHWTAVYTTSNRVMSLATSGALVYAGAHSGDEERIHPAIYRSADGGLSWTVPLSMAGGTIWTVGIHPTNPRVAIAGGGDYPSRAVLYQTIDGGDSWTEVFSYTVPDGGPTVNAVLIPPTAPGTWLMSHDGEVNATWGSYLLRTTDSGATWTRVHTITEDIVTGLVANTNIPNTLYASTWNNNLLRSTDGGATWTAVIDDGSAGARLVFDPAGVLYATREREVRRSTDGGQIWTTVSTLLATPQVLAIDLGAMPRPIYVAQGTTAGIYRSTDGGVNWEERNTGIEIPVLPQDIDVDPRDPSRILVAAVGGGWMTTDGGNTWAQPAGLSWQMHAFAINPDEPDIVYGGAYNCRMGAVLRSQDGGLTFTTVYTASFITSDCSGGSETLRALAIAPSDPDMVYAAGWDNVGGQRDQAVIVRSRDVGVSWSPVFTLPQRSRIEALAIHPTDAGVTYAGGEDCSGTSGPGCVGFVYRTTDGGHGWGLTLVTSDTVSSIVVHPWNPDILYVADRGYQVRKSTDGGDTWTVITPPGPSGYLLAIDPNAPNHVYLGGWGYFAETADGGKTWSDWGAPISQGAPKMDPTALTVDTGAPIQRFYAGFSGVWAYSRPAPQPNRVYLPGLLKSYAP